MRGNLFWVKKNGYGKMIYNDGESYEGQWLDDTKHGNGLFIWKDGSSYEGIWYHNLRNGRGKYKYSKNNEEVIQNWINDKLVE